MEPVDNNENRFAGFISEDLDTGLRRCKSRRIKNAQLEKENSYLPFQKLANKNSTSHPVFSPLSNVGAYPNRTNGFITEDFVHQSCMTPLQDTTNVGNHSTLSAHSHPKLFSDDPVIEDIVDDINYDSIETSEIVEYGSNDPDLSFHVDDVEFTHADDSYFNSGKSPSEYASLGPPTAKCAHCKAVMWIEERVNKNVTRGQPKFSLCCAKGQISLPPVQPTPSYLIQLHDDPKRGPDFRSCIRQYNTMFSFTSMGGTVDHSINTGRGPYIYCLNGQNHHVFGSLIPNNGDDPKFCQLYIYDTEHEVSNRMRWVDVTAKKAVNAETVDGLIKMLDETNELVKQFRMARDRFNHLHTVDLKIILKVCRSESGRENHIGPLNEVAGIMVGDLEETCGSRDIVIDSKMDGLKRISDIHPKLMSLQYPLLFPYGEDGYHDCIKYVDTEMYSSKRRKNCTQKEFYSYMIQVRPAEGMTLRLGGRLFQQYVVDAFSAIEQARLWWFRINQKTVRNELYSHICDYLREGDGDSSNIGKSVILPAGFVGSRRYMQQNFQDALAVCRFVGHPDLFLTMTCNSMWQEIIHMIALMPHCTVQNSPDIIARMFKLKLDQLLTDIKKNSYFGVCVGVMYVVEFQKRGLPHVHMLIWLDAASKKNLKLNVDTFVSAEIPDPVKDPVGYAAVKSFMIHGPCGLDSSHSPCMKDHKCIRHFPKKYQPHTIFDESGFPIYKRRKTNFSVNVRKAVLDNQWVVPYNRDLLVKYQCHINVEICCHARSLKYLFKYCLKGHDRATVEIKGLKRQPNNSPSNEKIDEIQAYFDGRYVCGAEAAYRIFGFDIHHRSVSVERLSFHLPGMKNCTFRSTDSLPTVVNREKEKFSKLEAFFSLNIRDTNARSFTYDEIPQHYVWNDVDRIWTKRKKGFQIGRLSYTHHSTGEMWYLRLLLSKVCGPTSFQQLRTVDGNLCLTFKDACLKYGLLDDDNEWNEVLYQCSGCGFPPQIRQLFVHIMVNCNVSDLRILWNLHWKDMVDDLYSDRRRKSHNINLILNDKQLEFFCLAEIDKLLKSIGKSLKDFNQMPQPPSRYLDNQNNNLIFEETSYDMKAMETEYKELLSHCNAEQLSVCNSVLDSVYHNKGGIFFVYGSGGCGKTYVWRVLCCKLRSDGKIILPVASSGIAATLLPGGRTAHSRFKIPILLDDYSLCAISHNSDIAALIKQTHLIIWDEAPMQHRQAFECLDRTLKDIMKSVDPAREHMPFGGITVLLGGDFRQILPVIPYGPRSDIVSSCITRSRLWSKCQVFILVENMRLKKGINSIEVSKLKKFANWVLQIGDGKHPLPINSSIPIDEDDICIPPEFCNIDVSNSVENMIASTYPNILGRYKCPKFLSERAILTPTNQTVSHLNSLIVDMIPGVAFSYFSVDKAEDFGGTESELNQAFPTEYLNSLSLPGLPHHDLKLKEGVLVMLMRNLNQTLGLCNGTRMMVTKCMKNCVQCEVVCGSFVGTRHFIPRMELIPSDSRLPFKLLRKQMPLQICYAMTINKSQGQSLKMVGLYLPKPVFTHGQLYVAVSRVTSPEGLQIFIDDQSGNATNMTKNVVYKEVFYNLPVC